MTQEAYKAMQEAVAVLKKKIPTYDVQKLVELLDNIGGIEFFNKRFKEMVDKELKSKLKPILLTCMGEGWHKDEFEKPYFLYFRNSSKTSRGMNVELTNAGIKITPTYHGQRVDKYRPSKPVEITIPYDNLDEGLPSAIAKLNELFSAIDSYLKSHINSSVTGFLAYSGCKLLEQWG